MKILAALMGISAILVGIVLEGEDVAVYLQPGGLLMVLGATLFFTLTHQSVGDLKAALRAVYLGKSISTHEAARHIAVLATPRMVAVASGGLGFILGLITLFQNLDDPHKIGGAVAMAIILAIHGLAVAELLVTPMINRISALGTSETSAGAPGEDEAPGSIGFARLIYAVLGMASVLGAYALMGGHLNSVIQIGAALIVGCGTLFFSLAYHSPAEYGAATQAVRNGITLSVAELSRHAIVLSTPRIIAIATGSLGFLLGIAYSCQNLEDPSKIGPGVAVSLISALYAIAISDIMIGPAINRLCAQSAYRANDAGDPIASSPLKPSLTLFLVATAGSLMTLCIVLYALSAKA